MGRCLRACARNRVRLPHGTIIGINAWQHHHAHQFDLSAHRRQPNRSREKHRSHGRKASDKAAVNGNTGDNENLPLVRTMHELRTAVLAHRSLYGTTLDGGARQLFEVRNRACFVPIVFCYLLFRFPDCSWLCARRLSIQTATGR